MVTEPRSTTHSLSESEREETDERHRECDDAQESDLFSESILSILRSVAWKRRTMSSTTPAIQNELGDMYSPTHLSIGEGQHAVTTKQNIIQALIGCFCFLFLRSFSLSPPGKTDP